MTQPKYASLNELFSKTKRMKNDPLASAGTNVVLSRGNPKAKLLIISETPGPEENRKANPL